VPSLDHLLALKLHALKQKLPHRTSKDAEDVEMLIKRNGLDISRSHYEELFLKYGTAKSTKPFSESSGTKDAGLELPIAPDYRSEPPLVTMDLMIARIAELRQWFPNGLPTDAERLAAKIHEEFVWKG